MHRKISKSSFYYFLILLLMIPIVFFIPQKNVSAEGTTTFIIKSPSTDSKINTKNVVISGTYTSNVDKSNLLFTAEENGTPISGASWNIDDTSTTKTWSLSTTLDEGDHILTIKIGDATPQTVTFTINTSLQVVNPTITITAPTSGMEFNTHDVILSGTFLADAPSDDLLFTAKENGTILSDSLRNAGDWNIDNNSSPKTWSFTPDELEEGNHNITVEIKNLPTSAVFDTSKDFSIVRPYVTEVKIILANGTEQKPGEDFTNVPLDSKIKITVADNKPMSQLVDRLNENHNLTPIHVLFGSTTINGTTEITGPNISDGKYYYEITFDPNDSELDKVKTYLVYTDSGILVDNSGNSIFPRLFKFTTMTNVGWDDPKDPNNATRHASSNPHGHYQLNTNMCAACHSSHVSESPSLTGGYYQVDFNEDLTKNQPASDPSQNYCIACHDGTTNAPSIKSKDNQHLHGYTAADTNDLKQQESCTSCHNPHLEWSVDNQNLLKDHYIYTHNEAHPDQGLDTPTVDSLDTSCDSCHEDNIDFSVIGDKGKLETLDYSKSYTAKGAMTNKLSDPLKKTISDYSLCLRCHNTEKSLQDPNPTDIETLYLDPQSGHNFALPDGQLNQKDGSMLNGPIPCAECHETHGSSNMFNLREILGNNPLLPDIDKFKTSGTTWNEDNEKAFCKNCHDKGTEIYGKKATFDLTILGHQDDSRACSQCHSDSSNEIKPFSKEKSMIAAHAPIVPFVISGSLAGGTYSSAQTVSLSANKTATIYYTTDGSDPTPSSSVYSSPISITSTTTLKYFGKDTEGNSSAVQTQTYKIPVAP